MMKKNFFGKILVCVVFASGLFGSGRVAASPEVPWTVHKNAVAATIRDYDSRLQALLDAKLRQWSDGFVKRRALEVESAAKLLARRASEIRDQKEISWASVGRDDDFRREAQGVVDKLLDPSRIRKELKQWAKSVEDDTRREMMSCLAQIIAWDLGMKFDEKLRGKVQAAVRSIAVEQLVADDVSREKLLAAIQEGLPGVVLTDEQKDAISAAAGELARRGARWLAQTQLQLPQDWTELLSGLAAMGGGWAAKKGAEWLDRTLTGEPDATRLKKAMDTALSSWNHGQLTGKLRKILRSYRYQVIDFVKSEGDKAFKGIEIGPRP